MKANKTAATHTPKELLTELKALVAEAETLTADTLSDHSSEALANLRERFDAAHERFADIYEGAKKKVIAGAKAADENIRENPYQAAAIAAGVGLLVGVLLGRRSK